jgi:hypothetical protein
VKDGRGHDEEGVRHGQPQEEAEVPVVAFSDAGADPRAVMILSFVRQLISCKLFGNDDKCHTHAVTSLGNHRPTGSGDPARFRVETDSMQKIWRK